VRQHGRLSYLQLGFLSVMVELMRIASSPRVLSWMEMIFKTMFYHRVCACVCVCVCVYTWIFDRGFSFWMASFRHGKVPNFSWSALGVPRAMLLLREINPIIPNALLFLARQHNSIMLSALGYAIARPSVCLSLRTSHRWIIQKRLKLGSRNFYHAVAPCL